MKTLIIIILFILILFFYNSENFAVYNNAVLPTISYICPNDSILKDDNMCYKIITPKCENNNCYLNNNKTEIKCPDYYTFKNNICYSSFNNSFSKPYCDDGYTILNNTCVQLNGLPTCPEGNIPYNNICKSYPFIPKIIYTCPDGSTNLYGGICNGNIYNSDNNSTTKETVSIVY
jgi:hypothetical protein